MSLKLHQQWLLQQKEITDEEEGYGFEDQEVDAVYESLFSSINRGLYFSWLKDTFWNVNKSIEGWYKEDEEEGYGL